jgi:hypothetical protein
MTPTLLMPDIDHVRITMPVTADGPYVSAEAHIELCRLLRKALVAAKPYIKEHGSQTDWPLGVIDDMRQIDAAIDAATIEVS